VPSRRSIIRHSLVKSPWYHSTFATSIRGVLDGRFYVSVMAVALLLALFLVDIWTLLDLNSSTVPDAILSCVMALFTVELILLGSVDAKYLMSFFQFMDIFGTASMIFDITFMLGTPNDVPLEASNDSDASRNLALLRATRAAKIGARAGRLSRLLRFLKFLPFLTQGQDKERAGIASLISGQLANLLATRVAGLTIILVMVIPLFEVWTFPQQDYSLKAWVNRLSKNLVLISEGNLSISDSTEELFQMTKFFSLKSYGPYEACAGVALSEAPFFQCNNSIDIGAWTPMMSGPTRQASALVVHTDTFMVRFNMHANFALDAGLAIGTILFIIVIMVFSSLALSSVVVELAVRPLERMLSTVRQIAKTCLNVSAGTAEQEDETIDIDESNEMKLLEKVVQKLAIIADLQTAKNVPTSTEGMNDEDIGIFSMMAGTNIVEQQQLQSRMSKSVALRKKQLTPTTVRVEDFGVSQDVLQSWSFNALTLTKSQRLALAGFTIANFHETGEGFINSKNDLALLDRFIKRVEKEYLPVPFHSFAHAVDVVHAVSSLMRLMSSETFLTEFQQYCLLIASIGHDLGHPGVNNGFLSEVGHELALQYNDRSPLENMHCAKLYAVITNPETNVFEGFTKEEYKEARKLCIETILHTDMMIHQTMVKDLQMTYQMNQEIFSEAEDCKDKGLGVPEIQVFSDAKTMVMNCILHSADVSNPCRAWEVSHAWAMVCLEEFFAQGDQEKLLNIPVQFLNDRDKLNRPNSQIGFIEFMIAPFYVAQIRLWPSMHELGENLMTNLRIWSEMWEKETSPSQEDSAKVKVRVEKAKQAMQDAITRAPPA